MSAKAHTINQEVIADHEIVVNKNHKLDDIIDEDEIENQ